MNHQGFHQKYLMFVALVLLFIVAFVAGYDFPIYNFWLQEIERIVKTDEPRPFNGIVAVFRGNELLFQAENGLADEEKQTQLTDQNQFIIGSISKQITAALVLMQADAGHLDLNAPIKDYLLQHTQDALSNITVMQLLNHTSGIVELTLPLAHTPGTAFLYNNANYDLLGKILEKVTHKPFNFLAENLFNQCHMYHSAAPDSGDILEYKLKYPKLALGYKEDNNGKLELVLAERVKESNPSGGVISTAEDLHLWNQCLHENGLLKKSTYQLMTSPSIPRTYRYPNLSYGLGIQITNNHVLEYSHSGYVPGYLATLLYYPQSKTTAVMLENVSWSGDYMTRLFFPHDKIRKVVRNHLLGEDKE